MPVPYRLFYRFHTLNMRGHDAVNSFANALNWDDVHREGQAELLHRKTSAGWDSWVCCFKGYEEDGWGAAGADSVMYVHSTIEYLAPWLNSLPFNYFDEIHGPLSFESFDVEKGTARYYDGVHEWGFYPQRWQPFSTMNAAGHTIYPVDVPGVHIACFEAWDHWSDTALSLSHTDDIMTRGLKFGIGYIEPSSAFWSDGHGLGLNANLKSCKLAYWNPCTNSFDRNTGPAAGGWTLVMAGLGYANADAEINDLSGAANQVAWGDSTYRLYIEKLDGTVVATLRPEAPWNEFSIDSNAQITILSMPALSPGTYQVRLHKLVTGISIYSYCGDWRTDPDGRMTPGARLYIYIGPTRRRRVIRTKWTWKKGDLTIFRYYAPIDVRTTDIFYEGMVLNVSEFRRGINDATGLPELPDIEIELDNTTKEFSKLLAQYWCKNQLVEIWYGYEESPSLYDELIFTGIVSDYDKPGSTWKVRLRSVMEKFMAAKVPAYRCEKEDYPNIHENHIGREMPEVLGLASLTEGSAPGAIEAVYVDTSAFKYLAARGSLYQVLEVYSDGVLKAETTDYEVSYEDGGRTYLTFTGDQGDAKITLNAKGYSYSDWDITGSAGGFVQNPAYIILFFLAFFCEVPDILVDIPSFDALAATYDDLGFGTAGYLIMQSEKDSSSWLQELLFSYGAKLWVTGENKITIGRKSLTDWQSNTLYIEGIDALSEPQRPQGFNGAANYAPVRWRHYPQANIFMGTKIAIRQSSVQAFEAYINPSSAWDFPWTDSEAMVDMRVTEEFLKVGFGDQKIIIPVSMEHFQDLTILDSFRYQDPFGLVATGTGEVGHYYYVEHISLDPMNGRMSIAGIDAQWMIRQVLILGDSSGLAGNWATATEAERIYAYLADSLTCQFADGEPGKILAECGG